VAVAASITTPQSSASLMNLIVERNGRAEREATGAQLLGEKLDRSRVRKDDGTCRKDNRRSRPRVDAIKHEGGGAPLASTIRAHLVPAPAFFGGSFHRPSVLLVSNVRGQITDSDAGAGAARSKGSYQQQLHRSALWALLRSRLRAQPHRVLVTLGHTAHRVDFDLSQHIGQCSFEASARSLPRPLCLLPGNLSQALWLPFLSVWRPNLLHVGFAALHSRTSAPPHPCCAHPLPFHR
jgi:hypothetical protein